MTDTNTTLITPEEGDRLPVVERELLDELSRLIEESRDEEVRALLADRHPADIASLLELLPPEERHFLLSLLQLDTRGEAVLHLPEEQRADYFEELRPDEIALLVDELEPDDATDVISELSPETGEQVLTELGTVNREATEEIRGLLRYDEETAGGRMTTDFVAALDTETVSMSIDRVRGAAQDEEMTIYALYVVDAGGHLVGRVRLQDLVIYPPQTPLRQFMADDVITVTPDQDQELVAQVMQRYDVIDVPVVDEEDRLLGVVTFDDIADIIGEEAGEDMFYLAGVTDDEEAPTTPPLLSMRRRLPWLIMNLGTAFIASMVVTQFEGTIGRVTALAALMPIVAGMGGNAAVQSITVMVRALATGTFGSGGKSRAVIKEATVGLLNGVATGVLAGIIVWVMWGKIQLGVLITIAMIVNLFVAGVVGTMVPLILRRLKFDPALSSGPLATTFTDVCGFLTFLGLATLTLGWILG